MLNVVVSQQWLKVFSRIRNLLINGVRLGSDMVVMVEIMNVLVRMGVIFWILLQLVIDWLLCCVIKKLVIRNIVVVDRLWLSMYSVDLFWFWVVMMKMFVMMNLKCEIEVQVISCIMLVWLIVMIVLQIILMMVSVMISGWKYVDGLGNSCRQQCSMLKVLILFIIVIISIVVVGVDLMVVFGSQ